MPDAISVDTSSFTKFARDLKQAEATLAVELRKNMLAAGELVAVIARRNASFSTRIPAATKVGVAGNRIRVYVNAKKAPGARAIEHGGRPGIFRHPVFNRDVWVSQRARPFLFPAAIAGRPIATREAKKAVDKVLKQVHSH